MKLIKKISLIFFILLVIVIVMAGIYIRQISHKCLPDYSGDSILFGLSSDVTIFRDSYGIPHIYADTEEDVYRATGYVMAQDRLWQMDLLRRLTTGRLSEIFGKDMAEIDLLFRSLEISRKSLTVLDSAGNEVKEYLEAFADGINQYINNNQKTLPPEFAILRYKPEPWETVHSVNLIGYMSWSLTMSWEIESVLFKISQLLDSARAAELIPDTNLQNEAIFSGSSDKIIFESAMAKADSLISAMGLRIFQASNNWAVSGSRSSSGMPLMANDMHLDLNAPGIWYQIHQVVDGKLNVTGVAVPGQPFVVCGHNENIAWGMTNVMMDDMDFYIEKINPADTLQYLYDGEWHDMRIVEEIINTREGDTIAAYNRFTHRGPVISGIKNIDEHVISMRWIGREYSNELLSIYKFNRAKNWDEFRDAARHFISISQNIVYADTDGNIGLQATGGIPVRKGNPAMFFPGDTSLYDWKGLVPFDELPFKYNPECAYVASANNMTVNEDYPYYISKWYDLPNRYEVIINELESVPLHTTSSFADIQSNQNSLFARKFVPVFISALDPLVDKMSESEKKALEYLKTWNFSMDKTSVATAIFEVMYLELVKSVFYDELGEELFNEFIDQDLLPTYLLDKIRITGESAWTDNINTVDKNETFNDNIIEAFLNSVKFMERKISKDISKWEWGELHKLTLRHPLGSLKLISAIFRLNRGTYPVGGSFHTVSPFSYPFEKPFYPDHGASHRHIYSPGNWDSSMVIIPTGICGIPASKHYCDQLEDYLEYKYKLDKFSRDEVENTAKYKMILRKE